MNCSLDNANKHFISPWIVNCIIHVQLMNYSNLSNSARCKTKIGKTRLLSFGIVFVLTIVRPTLYSFLPSRKSSCLAARGMPPVAKPVMEYPHSSSWGMEINEKKTPEISKFFSKIKLTRLPRSQPQTIAITIELLKEISPGKVPN